jgi:phosphoribosyl 1,2-cyclic phosphodiesterase
VSREAVTVKFCVLASGSSGNAALLATENTRILVDAGLSMRELRRRLAAIGEDDLSRIDAIVITHEHSDHVAGLPVLARNKNLRAAIYMTWLTEPAIDWGECRPRLETFQAGVSFPIGDIEVHSFSVPHDAVDPVGFRLEAEGVRIGMATDLGYVPDSIKFHLRSTDVLLLESNHDLDMLKVGPYPWSVKQRVMSRVGHLSNLGMAEFLLRDLSAATAQLVLGHISEQNNHPEIVRMIANEALGKRGLDTQLTLASQRAPTEVFRF